MLKAKKGNMLIIGLSDENIEKIKKDKPVKFNMAEVGFPDIDVLIFNGKDEDTMRTMISGSLHPYKTVFKDSRAEGKN